MLRDLLRKLIIGLGLEYLIFFSLEVILPGIVTSIFNINILLLSILLLIAWLNILSGQGKQKNTKNKTKFSISRNSYINSKWFLLLGGSLLFVNAIALYKVSILMILVYLGIVIIITKLLWRNL